MYEQYDAMKRYDEQSGLGVLPQGTAVAFADNTKGTIIQGYTDGRSLVQFPVGGGTMNRDVYDNTLLKIAK